MGKNRLHFIFIKDFLSKMITKKQKSKHFASFIFKTSKTLKVKILLSTKNVEEVAKFINETEGKKYNSSVTSKIV